jgi:hypothetical protein
MKINKMANDGKYFEKIVHLIEQSLDPESRVEFDVDLPILHSKLGKTTQCDIVITSGKKPRETTTLVEVQDRGSKIKPNDFRGWLKKVELVGAQHLICVSRQNFPESIKEEAAESGNKVRLVTLKETNFDSLPLNLFKNAFTVFHFDITSIKEIHCEISEKILIENGLPTDYEPDFAKITLRDDVFSFDKENLMCIEQICRNLPYIDQSNPNGQSSLNLPFDSPPFYIHDKDKIIKIGLTLLFDYKSSLHEISVTALIYDQIDHGTLGWILEAKDFIDGAWFKMPILKINDQYIIRNMIIGIPPIEGFEMKISINK